MLESLKYPDAFQKKVKCNDNIIVATFFRVSIFETMTSDILDNTKSLQKYKIRTRHSCNPRPLEIASRFNDDH
jgi:hypothetical protein